MDYMDDPDREYFPVDMLEKADMLNKEAKENPKMKGRIRNIVKDRRFGFIAVREVGLTEYFFHADDYQGDWKELEREVLKPSNQVWVEFDVVNSGKGPRAGNVRLVK